MLDLELAWDRDAHQGDAREHTLRVRVTARSANDSSSLPVNMAIALDCSASMEGEKLAGAIKACDTVIRQLRPSDRLWLAGFSGVMKPLLDGVQGGMATTMAESSIASLSTSGVTRTDLALDWIAISLHGGEGGVRIGILITDGHSTDWRGAPLKDLNPLRNRAIQLSKRGTALFTVGLGNADDFNAGILSEIAGAAFGKYLYAPNPSALERQLSLCLSGSQKIGEDTASLSLKLLNKGVEINGICRLRPDFAPIDVSNLVRIGALRLDVPTDILVSIRVPGRSGFEQGSKNNATPLVEVTVQTCTDSVTQQIGILYSDSYACAQRFNSEVEQDRLVWQMQTSKAAVAQADTPAMTVNTLEGMRAAATAAGEAHATAVAEQGLSQIELTDDLSGHVRSTVLTDSVGGEKP